MEIAIVILSIASLLVGIACFSGMFFPRVKPLDVEPKIGFEDQTIIDVELLRQQMKDVKTALNTLQTTVSKHDKNLRASSLKQAFGGDIDG